MKRKKNCSLLPVLGLVSLRKEFLKSRPGLQDDRPKASRSSRNPDLLLLCRIQCHEGTGVSLGIQGIIYPSSQVCILPCSEVLRENVREPLILPELKRLLLYCFQSVCVKQQSVSYCW